MKSKDFFEKEAKRYSSRYDGFTFNLYEKFYQRNRLNTLLNLGSYYKKETVLDAGCGSGNLLFEIREITQKPKLFGFDLSKEMIKIANSKNIANSKFFTGSVEKIELKDNSFDTAYCVGVLPYLNKVDGALKEIRRVVKPKGVCIVTFPYENFFVNFFRKNPIGLFIRKNILRMASYTVKYSINEFEKVCTNKGFKIIDKKILRFSEVLYVLKK